MSDKNEKNGKPVPVDDSFATYLWNPATKEFLGRTGASWFKITVFYIIFYICLAAFWALMLLLFYQTLDERHPKYTLGDSRIGSNPGLGFRPRPRDENIDSTLIWFKNGPNEGSWKYWSDSLEKFVEPYQTANDETGAYIQKCSGTNGADNGKFCFFDIKAINNNCTKQSNFGYRRGDPCVLIKLNRIYGWQPEPYNKEDIENNAEIPDEVKKNYFDNQNASQLIYITCEGENAADKENIGGIEYYPKQGIEFRYFPFTNQPGYLSPFVFVHFKRPSPGVLINIECKAWAKNIKHNRMDREGSVHFELLMDGF